MPHLEAAAAGRSGLPLEAFRARPLVERVEACCYEEWLEVRDLLVQDRIDEDRRELEQDLQGYLRR